MMETYWNSCKKNIANENSSTRKTKQNNTFIKLCNLWQEKIDFQWQKKEFHNFND